MGFEAKAEGRAVDGPSLEEKYREWLRSMRDRIDSELADEEFLIKTLPRLKTQLADESSKLQMLKDFVLDSMLREEEEEARVRIPEEDDDENKCAWKQELLRSKKYLVAMGVGVSSLAISMVSIILVALRKDLSPSESERFMCFLTAVLAIFGASVLYKYHVIRLLSGRTAAAAQLSCESPPASASAAAGVATGVALLLLAVLTFSGFFIPSDLNPMSPTESLRFMGFEAAVFFLFLTSVMVRNRLIESRSRVVLLPG
jgi:predicted membrane channel-forming protein YqfA (hemolysin III family)